MRCYVKSAPLRPRSGSRIAQEGARNVVDVLPPQHDNRREMTVDSETVPIGSQAPEFTLQAANDGREVSLSNYRGRPVVLVFLRGFG